MKTWKLRLISLTAALSLSLVLASCGGNETGGGGSAGGSGSGDNAGGNLTGDIVVASHEVGSGGYTYVAL